MNLLTLNLHKPLEWSSATAREAGIASIHDAFIAVATAPECAEIAMFWDYDSIVDETGDDGPTVARPLPEPTRVAASGLSTAIESVARPQNGGQAADRLEPGRYLFMQTRMPAGVDAAAENDWLADTLEWFAREAWWTKATRTGELIVRLVREDGKTAVQVVQKIP